MIFLKAFILGMNIIYREVNEKPLYLLQVTQNNRVILPKNINHFLPYLKTRCSTSRNQVYEVVSDLPVTDHCAWFDIKDNKIISHDQSKKLHFSKLLLYQLQLHREYYYLNKFLNK